MTTKIIMKTELIKFYKWFVRPMLISSIVMGVMMLISKTLFEIPDISIGWLCGGLCVIVSTHYK